MALSLSAFFMMVYTSLPDLIAVGKMEQGSLIIPNNVNEKTYCNPPDSTKMYWLMAITSNKFSPLEFILSSFFKQLSHVVHSIPLTDTLPMYYQHT